MSKLLHAFPLFIKASWQKKLDGMRIIFLFAKASYIVKFVPLRKYHATLFCKVEKYPIDLSNHMAQINFIRRVLKVLPGSHTCLKECIIVHLYFKKNNINIPIYLGVNTKDGFKAHAWYDSNRSGEFCQLKN